MKSCCVVLLCGLAVFCAACAGAGLSPEQVAQLPPPSDHPVKFSAEIKPILEKSCLQCHGHGRSKGDFRIDSRETLLKGGDSGAAVVPGNSAQSLLIGLVSGFDPDSVMPKKGTKLTREQIAVLRAWIDQGAKWDAGVTFAKAEPINLKPRRPELPAGQSKNANPVDRFLEPYFAAHDIQRLKPVTDRVFARRIYLDVVGLLPPPEELKKFVADRDRDKRAKLARRLLADRENYALHWMSFWNDLLRNDYKGTGYIDSGRKQITQWLYTALERNKPYDQFVAELVNPMPESEGFTKGIVWRGVVNASQTPQMQAAQNISQVFMGVNLKCASCHDSFINDWTLADAYGLASVYAEDPLEMVHCDKPTGKTASPKFIYPQLGELESSTNKTVRLKQLAELITQRADGRLARTLVNRLWQKFYGRGLVEPLDDMEQPAWNPDLLDWLAEDFADHGYDIKHLIEVMLTARAYQMPAVPSPEQVGGQFVFRGPLVRRMSAEQFRDALTALTSVGYPVPAADLRTAAKPSGLKADQAAAVAPKWIWSETNAAEKARTGAIYLRKDFYLEAIPTEAVVAVMCDNSFFFNVNGKRIGEGDDLTRPYVFDIRSRLKKGANFIAAKAVNRLPGNVEPKDDAAVAGQENPAGFLFYARLRAGTNVMDFASDATWRWSAQSADMNRPQPPEHWQPLIVLGEPTMAPWNVSSNFAKNAFAKVGFGKVRAALVAADTLQLALGRPNREQVMTARASVATTLQALELTNGAELANVVGSGAEKMLPQAQMASAGEIVPRLYEIALSRRPTTEELRLAKTLAGQPVQKAGLEDLLWSLAMLPEFQLIY